MIKIEKLGLIDFQDAYKLQLSLVNYLHSVKNTDTTLFSENNSVQSLENSPIYKKFFLLCQHNKVFTRGKGSKETNILDKTIPVILTDRGGDLSYHEPGQLVGYIILDLKKEKLTVKQFIDKIQDLIINVLSQIGITARKHPDLVGVWVGDKKVASIGIAVKQGVVMHGFALNVHNNMEGFSRINPCGLSHADMTSLVQINAYNPNIVHLFDIEFIEDIFIEKFQELF